MVVCPQRKITPNMNDYISFAQEIQYISPHSYELCTMRTICSGILPAIWSEWEMGKWCVRIVSSLSLLLMKLVSLIQLLLYSSLYPRVFLIHPSNILHRPQWPHLYHICSVEPREKMIHQISSKSSTSHCVIVFMPSTIEDRPMCISSHSCPAEGLLDHQHQLPHQITDNYVTLRLRYHAVCCNWHAVKQRRGSDRVNRINLSWLVSSINAATTIFFFILLIPCVHMIILRS